jgi:hypothetical protein
MQFQIELKLLRSNTDTPIIVDPDLIIAPTALKIAYFLLLPLKALWSDITGKPIVKALKISMNYTPPSETSAMPKLHITEARRIPLKRDIHWNACKIAKYALAILFSPLILAGVLIGVLIQQLSPVHNKIRHYEKAAQAYKDTVKQNIQNMAAERKRIYYDCVLALISQTKIENVVQHFLRFSPSPRLQ